MTALSPIAKFSQIINSGLEQRFKLKEAVRAKLKQKTRLGPDIEKIKNTEPRAQAISEFQNRMASE